MIPGIIAASILAAGASGAVPAIFLALVFTGTSGSLLLGAAWKGKVSRESLSFFMAVFASLAGYMFAVYQTPAPELDWLSGDYVNIAIKFFVGPLVFLFSYKQAWHDPRAQRAIVFLLISVDCVLILFQLAEGVHTGNVIGLLHSNFMGLIGAIGFAYSAMFWRVGLRRNKLLIALALVSFMSILLSQSRGALLAVMAGSLFFLALKRFARYPLVIPFSFFLLIATILLISVSFSAWVNSPEAAQLNNYSESLMGKRLDTGRSKLWFYALENIDTSPIHGIGPYARESWNREQSDGRVITLSVHNYYLAILLEGGVIGLGCVIALLFYLLAVYFSYSGEVSRLGLAIFLATLLQQTVEVSLTTGTFTAGIILWLTWGGAASLSKEVRASSLNARQSAGLTQELHVRGNSRRDWGQKEVGASKPSS